MMVRINDFFRSRSSPQVTGIALALVFVVAALDHATGYELSFSIFYLVPIGLATWYAGMLRGSLLSGIGVALFPHAPASLGEAINFADGLMYRVKKGGKNRLLFDTYAGPPAGDRPDAERSRQARGGSPEAPPA